MAVEPKVCTVPGCGSNALARGWCTKHYTRWQRHGDPLVVTRSEPIKPGATEKKCPRCGAVKAIAEFRRRSRTGAPSGYCIDCLDDYGREYVQTDHGRKRKRAAAYKWSIENRDYRLRKLYNISADEYDEMILRQGGHCAICGTDEPGGQSGYFAVDHCHDTGRVRGLLCSRCNMGLGLFRDDPARLLAAAAYLMSS